LEGEDLASVMRRRGPLPAHEVLHIVEGIAGALVSVHARGVVHRDIKPANVFLCASAARPFVKLVDFGIAKRLGDESLTSSDAFVGTPSYMSPEQIERPREVDCRTDIWAVGVLAFHAFTGKAPFRGENLANTIHAITT